MVLIIVLVSLRHYCMIHRFKIIKGIMFGLSLSHCLLSFNYLYLYSHRVFFLHVMFYLGAELHLSFIINDDQED